MVKFEKETVTGNNGAVSKWFIASGHTLYMNVKNDPKFGLYENDRRKWKIRIDCFFIFGSLYQCVAPNGALNHDWNSFSTDVPFLRNSKTQYEQL